MYEGTVKQLSASPVSPVTMSFKSSINLSRLRFHLYPPCEIRFQQKGDTLQEVYFNYFATVQVLFILNSNTELVY